MFKEGILQNGRPESIKIVTVIVTEMVKNKNLR